MILSQIVIEVSLPTVAAKKYVLFCKNDYPHHNYYCCRYAVCIAHIILCLPLVSCQLVSLYKQSWDYSKRHNIGLKQTQTVYHHMGAATYSFK